MAIIEIELKDGSLKQVEIEDGFTDEDVEAIAEELNAQLAEQPKEEPKKQKKMQFDATPSGLLKQAVAGIVTPMAMLRSGKNYPETYADIVNLAKQYEQEHPIQTGISNLGVDLYGYGKLPMAQTNNPVVNALVNTAIQGTGVGAIEGLKNGDIAGGIKSGSTIGGILNSLPLAARLLQKPASWAIHTAAKGLAGIEPQTLDRMIQADSKALDLSKDEAERLADETTERLRDAYETLKAQKGQRVADEASKLNDIEQRINKSDLSQDIADVYNKYDYDGFNTARELAGNTENQLNELINGLNENAIDDIAQETLSPKQLLGLKRLIGEKTNWDIAENKTQNKLLEQIYGKYNERLNELSPELAAANKDYGKLYDLLGERSRLRTILNPKADIETATSKLKNYKATNDNIYALEKQLVDELGAKPFLKDIDDVNAALNLAKDTQNGRNIFGIQTYAKELAKLGGKAIRGYKRSGLPEKINTIQNILSHIGTPAAVKGANQLLYGQISNTDEI